MRILFFLLAFFHFFTGSLQATYILRYSTTANGGILFTGNTLGLSKKAQQNSPGTLDSIGAFITTDLSKQVSGYPPGTTLNWQSNSSTAFLDLPSGSTVLYAELIWSGSYGFDNQIMGGILDTPVTLTTPGGQSFTITPDPATSQEAITPGFTNAGTYTRSADVTSIVQAAGGGRYAAGGVPATISARDDLHNSAGWTLAVVFQNNSMLTSNLSLFVGAEQASSTTNAPATVSGFCVPNSGLLKGSLYVSSIEGDANKSGDHMLFGSTLPLTIANNSLSGSNNPVDNFFAGQINTLLTYDTTQFVGSGQLDTRGSFGSYNTNPNTGQFLTGSRTGYDITSVDVSDKITYGQTTAYALGTTTNDDYMINALGLQVQIGSPIIQISKQVNGGTVSLNSIGDTVMMTFTIVNSGTEATDSATFVDALEAGLSVVPGSLQINGAPASGDPIVGLSLAPIAVGQTNTIQFDVLINSNPPSGNVFFNSSDLLYSFQPCGLPLQNFDSASNTVSIQLPSPQKPDVNSTKSVNSLNYIEASVGDTIIFTTAVTNNGQADALNAIFSDLLQPGLVLVPGSVTVDGVLVSPDPDLTAGFSMGPIALGQTKTVLFRVLVQSSSPTGLFSNTSTVDYYYMENPGDLIPGPPSSSNNVTVSELVPPLGFVGTTKKCSYLNGDKYCVSASWAPAYSTEVIGYRFYVGNRLVKSFSNDTLSALICLSSKDLQSLNIRAVYPNNLTSNPTPIEIIK